MAAIDAQIAGLLHERMRAVDALVQLVQRQQHLLAQAHALLQTYELAA